MFYSINNNNIAVETACGIKTFAIGVLNALGRRISFSGHGGREWYFSTYIRHNAASQRHYFAQRVCSR